MRLCQACQTKNPPESNYCQQCGQILPRGQAPIEPTMHLSAAQLAQARLQQDNIDVQSLFKTKARIILGRAPDCDIRLAHPSVSRYHARFEQRPEGVYVTDLTSVNGVWVSGRRIHEPTLIQDGDRVGIGTFLYSISQGILHSLDNSRSMRLEARGLGTQVLLPDGSPRNLLSDVNFVMLPGEFVCLLGPSGSGKSTLMNCLNGRRRATSGQVLANGEDFYRHFNSFRQSLGYVPQKDIVHTQLTVQRALYYTARLRLPPDTAPDELHARIESVLTEMELGPHRNTLIADLSGGQIKRVSLGAELLAKPSMLYIDEATSGLDAGTEARMMRLFRHLADQGRSLICITHNVDNVDQCHMVLILARGRLIFFGPPEQARDYFHVHSISEIYDQIATRPVEDWEAAYRQSPLHRDYVVERQALGALPPGRAEPDSTSGSRSGFQAVLAEGRKLVEERFPPLAEYFRQIESGGLRWRDLLVPVREAWSQLCLLTARYIEMMLGDRRGLRLLLLQAPVVALFLLVGFLGKPFRDPMPLLRELEPDERHALQMTQALGELLDGDQPLTPEQTRSLARIQLQLAGFPVKLDGNGIVGLCRRLLRKDLTPIEEAALDQARLQCTLDGQQLQMSGADLLRGIKRMHQMKLSERLLNIQGSVIPRDEGINPRYTYILLFILAVIVLWFGCNNAAKEIVKEEAIYSRERAVNLLIVPYLASKFVVLTLVTVVQIFLLMVVVYGALDLAARFVPGHSMPSPMHMIDYSAQFGVLCLLGMVGVALGLLLSACVTTPDRANALLPYVLIPQMILGGGVIAVQSGLLYYLALVLSPVYWAYRAIHIGAGELPPDYPGFVPYSDGVMWPCVALTAQLIILVGLTWWFMKARDV
ncbi:MAG: ATP-binding cassette domain-containing protein [Gemmataceae bacterium]